MPITYEILHDQRLVHAVATGTFTREDAFGYQREVWSRTDVRGYDQLVDMTAVERIDVPFPTGEAMQELVSLAATMDDPAVRSKFAIVATSPFAYGLARMYATYRALNPRSTREVAVFRSPGEARAWLGRPAPE
jgi:hypothetical protein